MTFDKVKITSIAFTCVILQVCCAYELSQMGVQGSYASIVPSAVQTQSAPTSYLPPPLHYLDPAAKRRITVITQNGTKFSFYTTSSALNNLIPVAPASSPNLPMYSTPTTPAPATLNYPLSPTLQEKHATGYPKPGPAVRSLADSNPAETKFILLYRPGALAQQNQEYSTAAPNTASAQQLHPYPVSATTQLPSLQESKYNLPLETTTVQPPYQPSFLAPAVVTSAPPRAPELNTHLNSAEVKDLALETIKNTAKVWKYLKYKFQIRRTTTTTQNPIDNNLTHGFGVLAVPKSSTPATLWKKVTSADLNHIKVRPLESRQEIPLSGDHLFSYRAKSFDERRESDEDFMT